MLKGQCAQTAQAHDKSICHFSFIQKMSWIKQNISLALQKKSVVLKTLKYFGEFERK